MRNYLMSHVAPCFPFVLMANTDAGNNVTDLPTRRRRGRNKDAPVLDRVVFHAFSDVEESEAGAGDAYVSGQEFTDHETYARYLRALYDTNADADTELSDAEIIDIIRAVEGDSKDAEAARFQRIEDATSGMDESDDETADVSAVRSKGVDVGAALDGETLQHMNAVADAKEVQDGSALLLALDFRRCTTPEQRAGYPVPGSSWDDNDRVEAAKLGRILNTEPDHWKNGRDRGSFYGDIVWASPFGVHARAVRECLAAIKANEELTDAQDNLMRSIGYPNWRTLQGNAQLRDSEDKRWAGKLTNMTTRVRRSFAYLMQVDKVKEAFDGLEVELVQEPDYLADKTVNPASPVLRKTNCLKLVYVGVKDGKRVTAMSDALSINTFNRFIINDVVNEKTNAVKRGAIFYHKAGMNPVQALNKTVERPPRRKQSKAAGLDIPTTNVNGNMAFTMLCGLANFFEDLKKDARVGAQLAEHFTGENAEKEVLMFGKLLEAADLYFSPFDDAYQALRKEEIEQQRKDAAAKIAAKHNAPKA